MSRQGCADNILQHCLQDNNQHSLMKERKSGADSIALIRLCGIPHHKQHSVQHVQHSTIRLLSDSSSRARPI